MRLSRLLCALLLALGCGLRPAQAADPDRGHLLAEAGTFFQEASQTSDPARGAELYARAALRFEKLVQDGVRNGKLYYNLGNTYFQLHDLGRAILNYRRALQYLPLDDNLSQNLAAARGQQADRVEPKQEVMIAKTLLFWHYDLPSRLRLLILVATNAVFWGGMAWQLSRRRGLLPWPLLAALALTLLMAGSLLYEHLYRKPAGVLLAPETTARKGDGQAYAASFNAPLHAGLEFTLIERRGDWLYIELVDGRRCWVEAAGAEMI